MIRNLYIRYVHAPCLSLILMINFDVGERRQAQGGVEGICLERAAVRRPGSHLDVWELRAGHRAIPGVL